MTETGQSTTTRRDTRGSASEFTEMLQLRRQLLESELRSDVAATKRFGVATGIGVAFVLIGVPMLVTVLGGQVDDWLELSFPWFSIVAAVALLGSGLLTVWLAKKRFRREFQGLRESMDELREDMVWLQEWVQRN